MKKHKHNWQFVDLQTYTNPGEPQETFLKFVCECGAFKIVKQKN